MDLMEDNGDFRCWDELITDAWGRFSRIFHFRKYLPLSRGYANRGGGRLQDRIVGSLKNLCVTGLANDESFSFIVDNNSIVDIVNLIIAAIIYSFFPASSAKSLQTLRLPGSEISDSIVEQVAGRLSSVTFLDFSYCRNIGAPALEVIGKHCKLLMGLRRTMHPLGVIDKLSQDDEAFAIAMTMTKLKQLEDYRPTKRGNEDSIPPVIMYALNQTASI
ncbi:Detected protein of unknown function [Hibiscus syriacus]|uniref:Uncharacterized protein n=1 Tax=Hibiscus syriacus TaxID=106335 RepID=A0A6A2ZQP1_HIBSY|nr:Detected protein of unknown function [Hibiscus syriacus]